MDYIYGKLDNPLLNVREYTGVETDTAETIVDNTENTIKVNVKLDRISTLESQIGEILQQIGEIRSEIQSNN